MDFTIRFEPNISAEDEKTIYEGLLAHNAEDLSLPIDQIRTQRFAFVVRLNGRIVAGLIGCLKFTSAFIDTLWVERDLRKRGLGRQLVEQAEEYARSKSCGVIFLNTLTKANVNFYENLGYVLEFERHGYMAGNTMRYFRKELSR